MRSGAQRGGVWGSGDAYDEGLCAQGGGVGDEGGDGEGVGVGEWLTRACLVGMVLNMMFGRSWMVL